MPHVMVVGKQKCFSDLLFHFNIIFYQQFGRSYFFFNK